MSKKTKNKKTGRQPTNPMAIFDPLRDDNGFMILSPTPKGKEEISKIAKKRNKKPKEYTQLAVPVSDTAALMTFVDSMKTLVKDGKYDAAYQMAMDNRPSMWSLFQALNQADDTNEDLLKIGKTFIRICKSFYEYDDEERELIPDETYDGILSHLLAAGIVEPTGYVPASAKKEMKRVPIKYDTLHNNMDKAYRILESDPVPEGVKESSSIEAFSRSIGHKIGRTMREVPMEVSPKIDGISLNGTIKNGRLYDPQTRGDENESIYVTGLNLMKVSCDHKNDEPFGLQYEVFVTDENRIKASEYLGIDPPYVSCRHAAAGIVHRLYTDDDPNLVKFLSFYPIAAEGLEGTYLEKMDYIQNFAVNLPDDMPERKVIKVSIFDIDYNGVRLNIDCGVVGCDDVLYAPTNSTAIDTFNDYKTIRENLSFAIDGIVFTVADDDLQKSLDRVGRTNKWQLAYKFDPATATSTVKGITLDTGTKGYRTIQVELEHPVILDGVRYDHVPVLSADLYEDLELREGDTVTIHRVGDVIPAITVKEHGTGKRLHLPTKCPDCGALLDIKAKKLYCKNNECPGNIVGKFVNFFQSIGLDGYSDSFAEILRTGMGVRTLLEVVALREVDFENRGIRGEMAKRFPKALSNALEGRRDYEIVSAMGLPGVGPEKAKLLIREMRLNDTVPVSNGEGLRAIAEKVVGPTTANMLWEAIVDPKFLETYQVISEKYNIKQNIDYSVLTRVGYTGGKLPAAVIELCREKGFEITTGKKFDILITSSMSRTSDKMEIAARKNTPVYLAEDFLDVYDK